jgi:hypothetical protein
MLIEAGAAGMVLGTAMGQAYTQRWVIRVRSGQDRS